MDTIEVGSLVTACRAIANVKVGEPPVQPGSRGRILRVEQDRGLYLVRWWVGSPAYTTDLYVKREEIE